MSSTSCICRRRGRRWRSPISCASARRSPSSSASPASLNGLRRLLADPGDRFHDDAAGVLGVAPMADPHPFLLLEILIVGEEMLDLLEDDARQVAALADV